MVHLIFLGYTIGYTIIDDVAKLLSVGFSEESDGFESRRLDDYETYQLKDW
jgi:hypothetical protein